MKIRIGEYLVEKGIIKPAELELALHRQLIYGGRIGTNLVKLGLISEDVLISLLQVMKNAKGINLRRTEDIPRSAIRSIDRDIALKYKCIPFEVTASTIKLACIDVLTGDQIKELENRTGYNIYQYIFPEIQWLDAAKKCYDYDAESGDEIVSDRLKEEYARGGRIVHIEERDYFKSGGTKEEFNGLYPGIKEKEESVSTFEDLKEIEALLEQDADLFDDEHEEPLVGRDSPSLDELLTMEEDFFTDYREQTGWKHPRVVEEAADIEPISIAEATIMLSRARNRDQVLITVLTMACNYADDAVFFFVRPEKVTGHMGMGKNIDREDVKNFNFSMLLDSLFLDIVKAGEIHHGPVAISSNNRTIFKMLELPWPSEACLIPVIVQNRIVGLLMMVTYEREISHQAKVNMQLLIRKASISFEILILKMKS